MPERSLDMSERRRSLRDLRILTAEDDLSAAEVLHQAGFSPLALFHLQQAYEKVLKVAAAELVRLIDRTMREGRPNHNPLKWLADTLRKMELDEDGTYQVFATPGSMPKTIGVMEVVDGCRALDDDGGEGAERMTRVAAEELEKVGLKPLTDAEILENKRILKILSRAAWLNLLLGGGLWSRTRYGDDLGTYASPRELFPPESEIVLKFHAIHAEVARFWILVREMIRTPDDCGS